jgi:omega-amidase
MKIATASLDQIWEDKEANIDLCEKFIRESSNKSADLVIFPEMTLTGFSPSNTLLVEDVYSSNTLEWFGRLSKQYNINIIFGACLKEKGKILPFNMLCIADKCGVVIPLYAKIHLFSYACEDQYLIPGNKVVTYKIEGITFGFAICYDLRFPELFSTMASSFDAIIIIANWPSSRVDHWNVLLRARAIENECIVFGVNRIGVDNNKIKYEESSVMVLPDGSIEAAYFASPNFSIYEINKYQVEEYRNNFPMIKDKRHCLYEDILRENNQRNSNEK